MTTTIYLSSRDAPRSLAGYGLWMEVLHHGHWYTVCALRPSDARSALRWMDAHPTHMSMRVRSTKI
jgi:hypothetical protein